VLGYHRLTSSDASRTPLVRWLRDPEKLVGVASYDEFLFDWPERLCVDAVLDAERMGAVVRNYTSASKIGYRDGMWSVTLSDRFDSAARAAVRAVVVLNMAGVWINRVNILSRSHGRRLITGTKNAHLVVKLPPDCDKHAIATLNRRNEPLYCLPWRGLHYFGPTETLYEGELDEVRVTEEEVDWLMSEANHLLPELNLKRTDILLTWAGVRPLTLWSRAPGFPRNLGTRSTFTIPRCMPIRCGIRSGTQVKSSACKS